MHNPADVDFREHKFFLRELSYYGVHPTQVDQLVTSVYMFQMNIHVECLGCVALRLFAIALCKARMAVVKPQEL